MSENNRLKFRNQRDLTSTIQRDSNSNAKTRKANRDLAAVGEFLNPIPKSVKYLGSAAVHIYYNETLAQLFLATQADGLIAHKCPELLAQSGMTDLNGTVMEKYGHRRPKKRSGF